jgi:Domain of unknown function (DUF1922)
MAHYLLPCTCGRRLTVTAAQAGDQLQCECGQRVEVPTLRHLAALEQVEDAPRRERTWGARQGLVFLGGTLIVLAAVALVLLQLREPTLIHEPLMQVDMNKINKMTPGELWALWPQFEQGIQRTLFALEAATFDRNRYEISQWRQWRWTALSVAGAGALVIAIGLFLVPGKHTSPTR